MERFYGLVIGAASFLIIGICHPLVIRAEYRWTKRCWWLFLLAGLLLGTASALTARWVVSTIFAVGAFSLFWGILELFQQEGRVLRGNFPMNPRHTDYYIRQRARRDMKNGQAFHKGARFDN